MKPLFMSFPHQTFDLTEVKVHRKPDGTIALYHPKEWEAKPRQVLNTHLGTAVELTPYLVTDWEETPLPSVAYKRRTQ